MPQIRVKDKNGFALPGINIRISDGNFGPENARFDYETHDEGAQTWPIPHWPKGKYTFHVNFPGFSVMPLDGYQTISVTVEESQWGQDVEIILPREETGEITPNFPDADLRRFPRQSLSVNGMLVGSAHNIHETINRIVDAGANGTRINLLSALWPGVDILPYHKLPNGKWDLFDWNIQYFDRLLEIKERFNAAGVVITWVFYNVYDWSKRGRGEQQNNTPYRHNVNGVFWAEGDETFGILPDKWSREVLMKICPMLDLLINPLQIGNEFPEKELHYRVRDVVREIVPGALLNINRQDDKPGQYPNMHIGDDFDFIDFHGRNLKSLKPVKDGTGKVIRPEGDLDLVFNDEPVYKTFNEFMKKCPHEKWRVTFSSDGARDNTFDSNGVKLTSRDSADNPYNWDELTEFFQEMLDRGYGIEHQSRAKMTPAPNHLMIEIDRFRKMISSR